MAEETKPLEYINEVILKKRRTNEDWAIRRKQQLEERSKRSKHDNFVIKKPEQFVREFRDKELDLVQMKKRGSRVSQRKRAFEIPESKLLFVIRIQGKNDMHPKTRQLLYSLGLRHIFSGVFVKANERVIKLLHKLEPYITYGYPNFKSVSELIYKKGLAKIKKERVPLTDNNAIEQAMGQYGIICIEDIVNEVANVGKHFMEVTRFMYPFKLNKPEKALQGKKKRYSDGGDTGNRGAEINELISKMN